MSFLWEREIVSNFTKLSFINGMRNRNY